MCVCVCVCVSSDVELVCQVLQQNSIYFSSLFRVCIVRGIWTWHVTSFTVALYISYLFIQ